MNSGPYSPPPSDAPPPRAPEPEPQPQPAPEPQPEPQPEGSAPEAAPGYYPPPAQAAGPPPRQRSMGPLIAILVIVVVLIAAVGGYVVGGLAYANSRLNSAQSTLNKVVDHQNDLTDTVNSLNDKLSSSNGLSSGTASTVQANKGLIQQIVDKSQAAQSQIDSDDSSLASADSSLKENSWLTVMSKSRLDKESEKIGHERKALSAAKSITAGYLQTGKFYVALYGVLIDFDDLGAKAQAKDLTGAAAAAEKLKTDTNTAITLDHGPGLPTEADTLLHIIQSIGTDFTNLINAAAQQNDAAANAAEKALESDVNKLDAIDYSKFDSALTSYYKPLIDTYNSEISQANAIHA